MEMKISGTKVKITLGFKKIHNVQDKVVTSRSVNAGEKKTDKLSNADCVIVF